MLTNLKSRLQGHITKALAVVSQSRATVKALKDEHREKTTPVAPPWLQRLQHKYLRNVACSPTGCPTLTGKRLARTLDNCHPYHLTVEPRYRKVTQ